MLHTKSLKYSLTNGLPSPLQISMTNGRILVNSGIKCYLNSLFIYLNLVIFPITRNTCDYWPKLMLTTVKKWQTIHINTKISNVTPSCIICL